MPTAEKSATRQSKSWAWLNPQNWFTNPSTNDSLDIDLPVIGETPKATEQQVMPVENTAFVTNFNISDMQNSIISKDNLSLQALNEVFSSAYLDFEEKDGELLVKDSYRVWVMPDEAGRFVRYLLLFKSNSKAGELNLLKAANQMNAEYLMFQTSVTEGIFSIRYHFWTEGGVTPKSVVNAYKFFSSAVNEVIGDLAKLKAID